ncbi:MAG: PA0069 family radical SAM protein [Planctomycetes bacterium]|nr:PA0069 family radical SAM protein [Planctomycetota bacterium]MCW8135147.1 PA0069 family radical SAM protein [Planctomycetota bacterium]
MDDHIHGRGTSLNPPNRFERIHVAPDPDTFDPDQPPPKTEYFWDDTKSIISWNDSPDLYFNAAINPYRGCEHGCVYCYARPFHEFLGYSAGLDFETKIHVKRNAAELLRRELMKPSWQPQVISISGVTDPYQPVEAKLRVTRSLLEVLAEFRNPVGVITKNALITRDIDLLSDLARHGAAGAAVSITTLREDVARVLEPRTSTIQKRFDAVRQLSQAGIPVSVMLAPIIPGLTDEDIPGLVARAAQAGAKRVTLLPVRLPHAVGPIFEQWLETHFPGHKEKVLRRIRETRGGELNDGRFKSRMTGQGTRADHLHELFHVAVHKHGLNTDRAEWSAAAFRRPGETRGMFG